MCAVCDVVGVHVIVFDVCIFGVYAELCAFDIIRGV